MLLTTLLVIAGQAANAAPPPPIAEKVICRRSLETGSLVKKRKTCRTQAQWEASARVGRQMGENMREFRGAGDGIPR